jgi:dipeptidase E
MRRLLLISSSRVHGSSYLEHCDGEVREFFSGVGRLLFVPYALHDRAAYAAQAAARFQELDLEFDSLHEATDPPAAVEQAAGLFIGGGNTFRLLKSLWDLELIEPIRHRVAAGMPYMGASAGSNVAGPTIKTTNDMPIVEPPRFDSLALVSFQINPHYIDPDPSSTHMGESRDTRLREFHEENDTPVLALREGSLLRVEDGSITLVGRAGGKLFLQGKEPAEIAAGEIGSLLPEDA